MTTPHDLPPLPFGVFNEAAKRAATDYAIAAIAPYKTEVFALAEDLEQEQVWRKELQARVEELQLAFHSLQQMDLRAMAELRAEIERLKQQLGMPLETERENAKLREAVNRSEQRELSSCAEADELRAHNAKLRELLQEARAFVNDHPGALAGKFLARIDAALGEKP